MFNKTEFLLEWMENYQAPTGYEHQIVIPLDSGDEVKLIARYFAYKKKEDFLFAVCNNEKQTTAQCAGIYDNLRLDERADNDLELVEISWRYESETLHQLQLSMKDRVYLMQRFMPFMKKFVNEGFGGPIPSENLMMTAMPQGYKYRNSGYVSGDRGQKQRAILAKRVGMGMMKDFGWSFAKYDSNLKLQPL